MGLTQARFAAVFGEAVQELGYGDTELSDRTKNDGSGEPAIDRNTIAKYQKPDYRSGPPDWATRRRLERALEIYLNHFEGSWSDIPVKEQRKRLHRGMAPAKAEHPAPRHETPEGPLAGDRAESVQRVLAFVREQLEPYRRDNRTIAPQIVAAWLADIEQAATAGAITPKSDDEGSESASRGGG